jgi:hypothetical protein
VPDAASFAAADLNHDGTIDLAEFEQMGKPKKAAKKTPAAKKVVVKKEPKEPKKEPKKEPATTAVRRAALAKGKLAEEQQLAEEQAEKDGIALAAMSKEVLLEELQSPNFAPGPLSATARALMPAAAPVVAFSPEPAAKTAVKTVVKTVVATVVKTAVATVVTPGPAPPGPSKKDKRTPALDSSVAVTPPVVAPPGPPKKDKRTQALPPAPAQSTPASLIKSRFVPSPQPPLPPWAPRALSSGRAPKSVVEQKKEDAFRLCHEGIHRTLEGLFTHMGQLASGKCDHLAAPLATESHALLAELVASLPQAKECTGGSGAKRGRVDNHLRLVARLNTVFTNSKAAASRK